jgi:diguanylate cyclase (GGDEF)-like protein/putative nucleotidyltransferase with HDIG domain
MASCCTVKAAKTVAMQASCDRDDRQFSFGFDHAPKQKVLLFTACRKPMGSKLPNRHWMWYTTRVKSVPQAHGYDSYPLKGIRVLIVDDDADVRRIEQLYLTRNGAQAEAVSGGVEALRALLQNDYDVLLVDLVMPVMGGMDFIREVRAMWPWIGILVMTAYSERENEALAWIRGNKIAEVLIKPLDRKALLDAVLRCAQVKKERVTISESIPIDAIHRRLANLRIFLEKALSTDNLRESFRHLAEGVGLLSTSSVVGILHHAEDKSVMVFNTLLPVAQVFLDKIEDEMVRRFELLSGQRVLRATLDVVQEGVPPESGAPDSYALTFTIPLSVDGKVSGLITMATPYELSYQPAEIAFFYQAASQIGVVLVALNRIRQFALQDILTGLLNRRGMDQQLGWAWESCKRRRRPLAVVILDLDHFKTLNDTHGHLVGDRVLEECARLIRADVRATDVVARFGGDEVVMALPDQNEQKAAEFCARLLARIREYVFCADTHQLRLTASAGIACAVPWEISVHEGLAALLAHADRALYEAKRSGRNRFYVWRESENVSAGQTHAGSVEKGTVAIEAASSPKGTVLIVDDEDVLLTWISRALKNEGYAADTAATLACAEEKLRDADGSIDVLLTDLLLQDGSGLDLIRHAQRRNRPPICLVMTGHLQKESGVAALREGVFDVLEKPFVVEQLLMAVSRAMEHRRLLQANQSYQTHLEDLVEERSEALSAALGELRDSYQFVLQALAGMLDAREHQTGQHSVRVAKLSRILARHLGVSERDCEDIYEGALLHDIGKIGIPDRILLKNGPLDEDEWRIMRQHPEIGYNVIREGKFLRKAAEIVYCHQERYDGSGYPRGLKGEQIPLGARIFAVADAYDAMRSSRSYKASYPAAETLARILEERGRQFDPAVVDALVRCQAEIEAAGRWNDLSAGV